MQGDLDRSRRFYRDIVGLAVYREFGPPDDPGLVSFPEPGLLEISGPAVGVLLVRDPGAEPWGLIEVQIEDPDGIRIVLVEVPAGHPVRRDPRSTSQPG